MSITPPCHRTDKLDNVYNSVAQPVTGNNLCRRLRPSREERHSRGEFAPPPLFPDRMQSTGSAHTKGPSGIHFSSKSWLTKNMSFSYSLLWRAS